MAIIDFHNHYYPPAYLNALRSGNSVVKIDLDAQGNPRLHYPGDYNVAVRGHRDIDFREQELSEIWSGPASNHADHPRNTRRVARERGAARVAGERCVRGSSSHASREICRPRHAAAE